MPLERLHTVGAVLPRDRAASAARALRREGLAGGEFVTAVWREDGFAIEPSAAAKIRAGLIRGGVVGALIGAVIGFLLLLVIPPVSTFLVDVLVGGAGGALAGAFFGAYRGLNRQRVRLWDQEDWEHVDTSPDEVLVVVDAGDRGEMAARILAEHGGRLVEPVRPR